MDEVVLGKHLIHRKRSPFPYWGRHRLVEILSGCETDSCGSEAACPYNAMFAEQTFHDAEGVISRNASRFISSIRQANAFQDGFAVIVSTVGKRFWRVLAVF